MKVIRGQPPYRNWSWAAIAIAVMLGAATVTAGAASIPELRAQLEAKQAEWTKATNSISLLEGFAANYPTRSQRLAADRTTIDAVKERISTIQRNNLIKVTLQLGVETAKTMKDACDIGQAASEGVTQLAFELLSNTMNDERKKKFGLDTETLTTPMTVKIVALNALANKKVPEIQAVQKILRSDLSTIRGQEWQDRAGDAEYDMTKPGNDPRYWSDNAVILVKLEKVKAALEVAKTALKGISDELDAVKQDTDTRLPDAKADELRLRNELAFIQFALNDALNAEISAARDAAAQAKLEELPPPDTQPPPYVAPKTEEETIIEYQYRLTLAVTAEANAHVAPIETLIDNKMADYVTLRTQYLALADTQTPDSVNDTNHLGWLQAYASFVAVEADRDLAELPTPALIANSYRELKIFMNEITRRQGASTSAAALLDQMQTVWQEANELRVEVSEWVAMAARQGVTVSYPDYDTPLAGAEVEAWINSLEEFVTELPTTTAAGAARFAVLSGRFNALMTDLLAEVSAAGDRMQQAEVALAQFIAAGAAADQVLEQSGWSQSFDVMPGESQGTSGYSFWGSGGQVYRTLTRRAFWMRPVTGELLVALKQPGEQGILAFQQVLNRYGSFLVGFTAANDRYHAKFVELRQAIEDINGGGYADVPPALSAIEAAGGITPDLGPPSSIPYAGGDLGSLNSSIDIEDRMRELNSAIANHWGLGSTPWLEDPSLDIPGFPFLTHNPASQLLQIKTKALREIPTWTKLYFGDWKAKRDAWKAELANWHAVFFLYSPFNRLYGIDEAWRTQFSQPAEDQVQADADALLSRYVPIYDPPVIASMTPDLVSQKLFPDSTGKLTLQVYSLSMGLSFQWYRSLNGAAYLPITNAKLPWYDVTYAEGLQNFYCRVWNSSGAVLSDVRTVIGIRRPRMIKQPTPTSVSARTGATVTFTCGLDETPAGGDKTVQWYRARLDSAGKPIIIHSPWGDLLYDMEALVTNPRMSGIHTTTLTITNFQPEDAGAYFVHVSNEYSFYQSSVARVTHVSTDVTPTFLRQPVSQEVLPGGATTFDVLVNGSPSPQYQWKRNGITLVDGVGISGATTAALTLTSVQIAQSGSFTCVVKCGTKSATSSTAVLSVKAPAAPLIATAPKAVIADPGATVSFSVAAKGGFPTRYKYQWQFKHTDTWTDLAGMTSASITLVGITEDDEGEYRCVISNGASAENLRTVTSPIATLTVNGLPVITTDPQDLTAKYGTTVTFIAAATGAPAPALQWYRIVDGGTPVLISGQTRSTLTLTLTNEPWASGVSFQVFLRATNRFGSADSSLAELTLEDPFDATTSVGRYLGLVGNSASLNNDLGGLIDLTVTKVGSFTGKINMAGRVYAFKGSCDAEGKADVTIPRAGLPALITRLTFSGDGGLSGQLWQTGDRLPQDLISAHQLPWTTKALATAYAGTYTVALQPPSDAPADAPLGTGYLTFKIATTGACSGSGRLADGTSFTLASSVWPDGSLPLFNSLYSYLGSILGTLDTASTPADGVLRWRKKPTTPPSGRSYRDGIGPMNLAMTGGRYLAPTSGHYLLDLTLSQAGALSLAADHGGLTTSMNFPFTLSTGHLATFNISTRDFAPKLTFSASTGTMSGSFYVLDTQMVSGKPVTLRRTATVAGVLLPRSGTAPPAMLGYFLLPGLTPSTTTSPILSGSIQVVIP